MIAVIACALFKVPATRCGFCSAEFKIALTQSRTRHKVLATTAKNVVVKEVNSFGYTRIFKVVDTSILGNINRFGFLIHTPIIALHTPSGGCTLTTPTEVPHDY